MEDREIVFRVSETEFHKLAKLKGSKTWYGLIVKRLLGKTEREDGRLGHIRNSGVKIESHPVEVAPC